MYEIQNIVQSVNDTTAQELTGTVMSRSGNTLTVRVTLHDNTNTILAATDPTGTINTGTVQLTPDASGNYIATQGIAVGELPTMLILAPSKSPLQKSSSPGTARSFLGMIRQQDSQWGQRLRM